jgi:putative ATPase
MAKRHQPTLFEPAETPNAPLAFRMRPRTLEEYVGQGHLLGAGKLLSRVLAAPRLPSLVLWGPPGTGKTTLAQLIANQRDAEFVPFSAVTSGVPELRAILKEARERKSLGRETLLFVDEIHRFNKSQQDAFLQHLEDGTITLIGATTENPSFQLNAALLSRLRVLTLKPLTEENIRTILERAFTDGERGLGLPLERLAPEALKILIERAGGDARSALNTLEAATLAAAGAGGPFVVTAPDVLQAMEQTAQYDRAGEHHYDTISAFIKTIRGSNPDAALFWLARMLNRGEDAVFIARRLVILASEDVGNADPQALPLAVACMQAVQLIGMPEAVYPLTQTTTYLALAPKSNAAKGIFQAMAFEQAHPNYQVPIHLRNAPTKLMKELGYGQAYRYPHDYPGGWVDQSYWPDDVAPQRFYEPKPLGFEAELRERRRELSRRVRAARSGQPYVPATAPSEPVAPITPAAPAPAAVPTTALEPAAAPDLAEPAALSEADVPAGPAAPVVQVEAVEPVASVEAIEPDEPGAPRAQGDAAEPGEQSEPVGPAADAPAPEEGADA